MAHFDSLSFCFPMYNEEDYILQAVAAAREAGDAMVADGTLSTYEVLIVDDCSTDRTAEIADRLAAADPRVRVIHHEVNRRLGGSIKSLLGGATSELLLYTDADLPFDMMDVLKATRLARIYQADLVSCYRHDRTSEGPRRTVYSFVYNWLIRLLFGIHLRDINFSFKLIRKRVLDRFELLSEGSFIDAELLVRTQRMGFKIIQFGVDYFPRTRGVSTLSSPGVIVKILRELVWLWWRLRSIQRLPDDQLALPAVAASLPPQQQPQMQEPQTQEPQTQEPQTQEPEPRTPPSAMAGDDAPGG